MWTTGHQRISGTSYGIQIHLNIAFLSVDVLALNDRLSDSLPDALKEVQEPKVLSDVSILYTPTKFTSNCGSEYFSLWCERRNWQTQRKPTLKSEAWPRH